MKFYVIEKSNPLAVHCLPSKPDYWCSRCARNIIGAPLPQGKYILLTHTDSTVDPQCFRPSERSKGQLRGPGVKP